MHDHSRPESEVGHPQFGERANVCSRLFSSSSDVGERRSRRAMVSDHESSAAANAVAAWQEVAGTDRFEMAWSGQWQAVVAEVNDLATQAVKL